jgi:hypothetical protein
MTSVCPAGHTSAADDYCDVCGMPIAAAAATAAPTPPPPTDVPTQAGVGQPCPNCSTMNAVDALFCENCGYDFTTGTMPRPLPPVEAPAAEGPVTGESAAPAPDAGSSPSSTSASLDWVAEVWIDPAWYAVQESPETMPSPGLPEVVPLRAASVLVGRTSHSRNIHPDIDCGTDSGVSRRQSQLTTDGTRWWVEDLESANGTFVAPASAELPEDPIAVGVKRELAGDDRVYVGAWTRIVVRPSTDDERATLG